MQPALTRHSLCFILLFQCAGALLAQPPRQFSGLPAGPLKNDVQLLTERMKDNFFSGYLTGNQIVYPIRGFFADIDYKANSASNWQAAQHWDRLIDLAKLFVYQVKTGSRDSVLYNQIVKAIDFWYAEKPVCSNYWWNAIGVPLKMGEVLVLLNGLLPNPTVSGVIQLMRLGIKDDHYEYHGLATGQNQVWLAQVHSMIGIVQGDTAALKRAFTAFHNEVFLSAGEGIQYDYSFFQHGHQLYSGGYGIGYTKDIARLIKLADGTRYQFPPEKIAIFSSFIIEGQCRMAYKGVFDYSAMGREISRLKNADGRVQSLAEVCDEMASLDLPRKMEFMQMSSLLKGDTTHAFTGNKHFWRADFMVHQTPLFYTSVKMASDRIKSTEWGNGENMKSYYLGQGVQLVMRNGNEYKQVFPVWDWQRLPGILAEQRDTLPMTRGPWGEGAQGKKPFTGGVSDGSTGFAVNDYAWENVKAHRAWFCFQNEIVVMGAGIENNSGNRLLQSVNQCYLKGPVLAAAPAPGNPAIKIEKDMVGQRHAGWVFHDSIGYFFPEKRTVTVKTGIQKGAWKAINTGMSGPAESLEKNIFNLWIDFGPWVKNAHFMYVMVPGISAKETAELQLPLRLIANNQQLQALWHTRHHILMAAFYAPGKLNDTLQQLSVSVDKAVLVIVKESARFMEITLSNPENKGGQVRLLLNRKLKDKTVVWSPATKTSAVTINLPDGNDAGKSTRLQFEKY